MTREQEAYDAREKAKQKAQEEKKRLTEIANKDFDKMKNELLLFSQTIDKDHFNTALTLMA